MFDFTLPDWSPSKEELKKDEILGKYLASQRNIRISLDTTYIDVPFIDEVYIYKTTSSSLTIYFKSCTKTNNLSEVADSIEKYLLFDYLKIITNDKKERIANSKKEIMQLFLSESGDGDLSYYILQPFSANSPYWGHI